MVRAGSNVTEAQQRRRDGRQCVRKSGNGEDHSWQEMETDGDGEQGLRVERATKAVRYRPQAATRRSD